MRDHDAHIVYAIVHQAKSHLCGEAISEGIQHRAASAIDFFHCNRLQQLNEDATEGAIRYGQPVP